MFYSSLFKCIELFFVHLVVFLKSAFRRIMFSLSMSGVGSQTGHYNAIIMKFNTFPGSAEDMCWGFDSLAGDPVDTSVSVALGDILFSSTTSTWRYTETNTVTLPAASSNSTVDLKSQSQNFYLLPSLERGKALDLV